MANQLSELKRYSTIVADTGDISEITTYAPQDATTNPSLILKAAQLSHYKQLINNVLSEVRQLNLPRQQAVEEACDRLAVQIGCEILSMIPGRISTEVSATLSYDIEASLAKARKLVALYNDAGVPNQRILIKLAATWQGIRAAQILEREGINCNLTLLFSFAQARACAEAGVYLISPFVGRITDWYQARGAGEFTPETDPGVRSVKQIYQYYKQHDYPTVVMAASFRNVGQITALAGCDRLTINPHLLEKLSYGEAALSRALSPDSAHQARPFPLSQSEFLWEHNQDAMASEKLAEGIRNFAIDQHKLETMMASLMFDQVEQPPMVATV
ncbi:transaldolase [Aliagarivorans marinus]|uniref:transaldolase n=1 Tax=Aliagarivorans marinus TaxID=561965 RepID=UPI000425AD20|nr:transaldolase [Aliagarivorans marinus]